MTTNELKKQFEELELENVVGLFIYGEEDYSYDGFSINISRNNYLKNKKIVDDFVKRICSYKRKFVKSLYFISDYHLNEQYFKILAANDTLKTITLHNHCLTKKEFDLLSQSESLQEINSSSVSPELTDCYDKRLSAVMKRYITEYLNVKDIIYEEDLNIYEKLTEEQVSAICNYLEKRKVKGTLTISNLNNSYYIKRIIDKFEAITEYKNKDNIILIEIEERHLFDYQAFTDEKQNLHIRVKTETDEETDMNDFIKTEAELRSLIKPLQEHIDELSPFEKHLWLHNIVSTFRKYKKESNEEDWRISRYLNKLLFNDYMVCVGFGYLYKDLSRRIGLDSWENVACTKKHEQKLNYYNHINNLNYIEDKKYDINGIYLSDTTFDNHEDNNLFIFNHFFLTPTTYTKHIEDIYSAGFTLLTVKEKEEFLRILKEDRQSLLSLVTIIHKYYPNHDFFRVAFDSNQAYYDYCLEKAEELYEIAQTITVEEIPEDKIKRALINIEKIKNPNITAEELLEKIDHTFEIYHKLNKSIYNQTVESKKTLQ